MKLVSMAKKKEASEVAMGEDSLYPYGTEIRLEDDQLVALGMKELPKVGTVVNLQAKAKVISASAREEQDGDICSSICLQITDLGVEPGSTSEAQKAATLFKEEE